MTRRNSGDGTVFLTLDDEEVEDEHVVVVKVREKATQQPRASTPYNGPQKRPGKTTTKTIKSALTSNDEVLSTTMKPTVTLPDKRAGLDELLLPEKFFEPDDDGVRRIPYPKSLSPSSIKEFQACPQSFFFQYVLGLQQPTSLALAKGSMCHAALERVFDLNPTERSLPVLQNLFRTAWSEHRLKDLYRPLFEINTTTTSTTTTAAAATVTPAATTATESADGAAARDFEREATWGREGLALLANYWRLENAAAVPRPNPVQREVWVRSSLPVDPRLGVTAVTTTDRRSGHHHSDSAASSGPVTEFEDAAAAAGETTPATTRDVARFLVRGIVDRLDMVQDVHDKSAVTLRLIDYKSGKAPDLKYSPAMNQKIQSEAFAQLLIYALLLREKSHRYSSPQQQPQPENPTLPLRYLRLLYLTDVNGQAVTWDMDLGATQQERDQRLQSVHQTLSKVWTDVCHLIDMQDFRAFAGCQRQFCYCHQCRPRFVPGSVWEPPIPSSAS